MQVTRAARTSSVEISSSYRAHEPLRASAANSSAEQRPQKRARTAAVAPAADTIANGRGPNGDSANERLDLLAALASAEVEGRAAGAAVRNAAPAAKRNFTERSCNQLVISHETLSELVHASATMFGTEAQRIAARRIFSNNVEFEVAKHNLGLMLATELGGPADYARAEQLFIAADFPESKEALGDLHMYRLGKQQNVKEAARMYNEAGTPGAFTKLAMAHCSGAFGPPDTALITELMCKGGNPGAAKSFASSPEIMIKSRMQGSAHFIERLPFRPKLHNIPFIKMIGFAPPPLPSQPIVSAAAHPQNVPAAQAQQAPQQLRAPQRVPLRNPTVVAPVRAASADAAHPLVQAMMQTIENPSVPAALRLTQLRALLSGSANGIALSSGQLHRLIASGGSLATTDRERLEVFNDLSRAAARNKPT